MKVGSYVPLPKNSASNELMTSKRPQTLKLLEERERKPFQNGGTNKVFLMRIPGIQEIK